MVGLRFEVATENRSHFHVRTTEFVSYRYFLRFSLLDLGNFKAKRHSYFYASNSSVSANPVANQPYKFASIPHHGPACALLCCLPRRDQNEIP